MSEQKTYVPKSGAKEITFQSTGNKMMKLNFHAETLASFAKQHANEKGYITLCVTARKEVGQYGDTHCVWLDTWKPDPNRQRQPQQPGASVTNQPDMSGLDTTEPPF